MKSPTNSRLAFLSLFALLSLGALGSARAAEAPKVPPLTTVDGSPRIPGKFVWADLVTDDAVAARDFYARLFGWKFQDHGGYLIALNDGRPLAGLFQRPRPKDRPEAKPRWFGYISVSSVGKAESAVTKAGGRVLAATKKIPNRGEQAVFADPEGALFGVVKSSAGDPEDFLAEPGDWIWAELVSRDARKAGEFYRSVAGYDVVANDTSPRAGDYVFASRGYARAAALTLPPNKSKVLPTWLFFVRVKSVTECVAKVSQLGGKLVLAPAPELFQGKLAVIADPTGAQIGVMEWAGDLLKGGN